MSITIFPCGAVSRICLMPANDLFAHDSIFIYFYMCRVILINNKYDSLPSLRVYGFCLFSLIVLNNHPMLLVGIGGSNIFICLHSV